MNQIDIPMDIAIEATNLEKNYEETRALYIPELSIKQGESFGLVGNNGAGKTTFFRLLLDLIRVSGGKVKSKGVDVKTSGGWKNYTGSYLDQSFLIDFLTPEEYFEFLIGIYGLSKGDLENFYNDFETFFNGEILDKKKYIRDLSQGNRQKVGIAAALLPHPEILVLDEPFNGLDPSTQLRLVQLLNELKRTTNTTMLISSHDLRHVTEVCDRIVVLEKGKVIHDLNTNEDTLKKLESYFAVYV